MKFTHPHSQTTLFEPLGSLGEIGVLILGAVICLAGGFVVGKIIEKKEVKFITSFFSYFYTRF